MHGFSQRGGGWVVAQAILMAGFLCAPLVSRGNWSGPLWFWLAAGLITVSAGCGLAGVAVLRGNRTIFPRPRPDSQLVRHGIYRHIRHPLYTSVMAFALGWALGWRSYTGVMMALLTVAFLVAKAFREERWLQAQFPEYENYARTTTRFIPGLF